MASMPDQASSHKQGFTPPLPFLHPTQWAHVTEVQVRALPLPPAQLVLHHTASITPAALSSYHSLPAPPVVAAVSNSHTGRLAQPMTIASSYPGKDSFVRPPPVNMDPGIGGCCFRFRLPAVSDRFGIACRRTCQSLIIPGSLGRPAGTLHQSWDLAPTVAWSKGLPQLRLQDIVYSQLCRLYQTKRINHSAPGSPTQFTASDPASRHGRQQNLNPGAQCLVAILASQVPANRKICVGPSPRQKRTCSLTEPALSKHGDDL